jgi:copper transport protein
LSGGGAGATAVIAPAPGGHASVTLALRRADGTPMPAKEVSVTFSNPQAGVEGIVRSARHSGKNDGSRWVIGDVPLLASGQWRLKADALISDFESVSLDGQVDLRLDETPRR